MSSTDRCRTCGKVHPKCTAHNRAGAPCGRPPAANQSVCNLHGAKTPAAIANAKTREVEDRARRVLAERWAAGEDTAVADPLAELARVAGEVVAFKDMLRDQVLELRGELAYWTERTYETEDTIRTEAVENLRAVVTAYERAQERCAKVLGNIVKLDLAGRMLAHNTAQATVISDAVREGLSTVDLSLEVRHAVQDAIADALERAAGGAPQPKELTA